MKILLIQCPSVEDQTKERVYPLGIAILGGIAEDLGHEVRLFDMNMAADPFGELIREIEKGADLIGLSLRNIDPLANKNVSLVPPFTNAAYLARLLAPKAVIIAGGTGFSLFPQLLMDMVPELDYGFVGESELSFASFLHQWPQPQAIPGLYRRDVNRAAADLPRPIFCLEQYHSPRYSLLPPGPYLSVNQYVPAMGVETRRGCPLHCAYCCYPQLQGRTIRCRPVQSIVDEIEMLHRTYGVERFHFNDPVVNLPRAHLNEICREILRRKLNISWTGFFREDLFSAADAALYAESGCNCFSFSPDGMSPAALAFLEKDLTAAQIKAAAATAAATDVCALYHFMVNVPGEKPADIEKGKRLLNDIYEIHAQRRGLGSVILNHIRILPGTKMTAYAPGSQSLLYPVYHNPPPFTELRYELETISQRNNLLMWYGLKENGRISGNGR